MLNRVLRVLVPLLALLGLPLIAACGSDSGDDAAPVLADANATGSELATEFLTILQNGDRDALDAFLDESFQLQRADGSAATKAEYLGNPAKVTSFELGQTVTAVQSGSMLSVRWSVIIDEVVNGKVLSKAEAPRLSAFVWDSGRWRLAAHANFNVPADEAAPTLADPNQTGRELVIRFGEILQTKDRPALEAFLAGGFQLQRADGTSSDRTEYLALDIDLKNFAIGDDLEAYQEGNALTVRWSAKVVETVDGQPRSEVFAPRLSTFLWVDGAWRLLSHANFNPPVS